MVMHKPDRVITTLYMSTFVTVLLVVLTRVGFPYSAKPGNLAPHRSFFLHTARQFYDRNGLLLDEDSGYFVVNLDRNSPNVLFPHVPEMYDLQELDDRRCRDQLLCGMPIYYPCASMLKYVTNVVIPICISTNSFYMLRINHWIPATKPRIYQDSSILLLAKEEVGLYTYRLLFRATGT